MQRQCATDAIQLGSRAFVLSIITLYTLKILYVSSELVRVILESSNLFENENITDEVSASELDRRAK